MILGFTGHRRLQHDEKVLGREIVRWLKALKPEKAISGMALGYDQLAARACVCAGVPFIAALPAKEQPDRWPADYRRIYDRILARAEKVVYVDALPKYKGKTLSYIQKLFNRNQWIVDNLDKILAYYLNTLKGGTFRAVCYAHKTGKLVIPVDHAIRTDGFPDRG